jgi:hypothetical protein
MAKKAKTKVKTRPRSAPASQSQALMRVRVNDPDRLLPDVLPREQELGVLGESPALGSLGVTEVKLSAKEEAVLSEAVNPADVLIKPTGQPYLPHAKYRAWFTRAFGRLGWMLVAKAKPVKVTLPPSKWDIKDERASTRHMVLVPHMLYIHNKPAAFAWGEQEFNETNAEQSYGDAVEATAASAIRRCAKALSIGLELWDRDWLNRWVKEHCVAVQVKSGNYTNTRWRRKVDPPLDGEIGARHIDNDVRDADYREEPPAPKPRPQAGNDGKGDEKITLPQRQRMTTIARKAGRIEADVKLWLKKKWGVDNSRDIKRKDYDQVCRELEAPGALPLPGDGEGV